MMKNSLVVLMLAVASAVVGAQDNIPQAVRLDVLRVRGEEYAVAFRTAATGTELWCTAGTDRSDGTQRRLVASVIDDTTLQRPNELADVALNDGASNYNGVPSFHPCNPNYVAFVSNRQRPGSNGTSNDIFFGRYDGSVWNIEAAPFNSPTWDDTPAFGTNGNALYFASDRRSPGTGRADLYVCTFGVSWSEPVLLYTLSTDSYHEASPYVGPDGRLYYSTNRDGDQDIWSVELDSLGFPSGDPVKLALPGVNMAGSDEYHPVIAPSGAWFLFSSNRAPDDSTRSYHVYAVQRLQTSVSLDLTVVARTYRRDKQITQLFGSMDSIAYVQTGIRFTDVSSGQRTMLQSGADGKVSLPLITNRGMWSGMANPVRTFIVEPQPHSGGYIAAIDTLVVDVRTCHGVLEHKAFLYDTTKPRRVCQFAFRTFNVPFFVTTYWCPTTVAYRNYTPCTSLFVEKDTCIVLQQPEHCATNEAYAYTYTPAKIERRTRGAENCVAYEEFRKNGAQWANDVDVAVNRMRDEVAAALNEDCVQGAVARGLNVTVTIIGTTDDRSIDPACMYTGQALADIMPFVNGIRLDERVTEAIVTGKHFNGGGFAGRAGGNQLLSSLRALYFAILFDRVCTETIPVYRDWKAKGQLVVASKGEAIDQRSIPYEYKRAAGVEINVPNFEQIADAVVKEPHRRVVLCPILSGCNN